MSTLCNKLQELRLVLRETQVTLRELGTTLRSFNPLVHALEELLIRLALAVLVAYHIWRIWALDSPR
jgi:hypothetical protein